MFAAPLALALAAQAEDTPLVLLSKGPPPAYPVAATGFGYGAVTCVATVSINDAGVPYNVLVSGCPAVFAEPTREAVRGWRWTPPTKNGVPTASQTVEEVAF